MVITVISVLSFGGFASDGWKRCFQTLETLLQMDGSRLSDGRKRDRDFYGKKMLLIKKFRPTLRQDGTL